MDPSRNESRRRVQARPCGEALESRQLLTGGVGNTFALVPGTIAEAGGGATVPVTVSKANFVAPRRGLTLGVDVAAPSATSQLSPVIASVSEAGGRVLAQSRVRNTKNGPVVSSNSGSGALLATIKPNRKAADAPIQLNVKVGALSGTKGDYLLGFYLAGDADGNGQVDQADVRAIKTAMGAVAGDTDYNFDADGNRDGRITRADVNLARQNLGAKVSISPIISANLDPATDTGVADRVTASPDVHFTGVASPDARVTFAEVDGKTAPVTTTVDAAGNYSINVRLVPGPNNFKVSSTDGFGQTISGKIAPVTLGVPDAITTAAAADRTVPAGSNTPDGAA